MQMIKERILGLAKRINPSIDMDSRIFEQKMYNSIEMITFIVNLEDEFNIMVSPKDINRKNFGTVSDIAEYVISIQNRTDEPFIDRSRKDKKIRPSAERRRKRNGEFSYPENASTVLDFLENAYTQLPRRIAVQDQYGIKMTFKNIWDYSRAVGTYIQRKYKCRNRPFIVLERRNVKCLIMFLGVIWSGNYYVALDEGFAEDRLKMMIDIVKPEGLLYAYNSKNEICNAMETNQYDDMILQTPDDAMLEDIRNSYTYDDVLYGVYTSGTTGTPKCILKSHGAMVDFITGYVKLFGFDNDDIIGSKLSFMFDAITKDLYSTFYCGAKMHVMARGNVLPSDDAEYIIRNRITSAVWAPSLLTNFAKLHILDSYEMPTLKRVLFVGEALPAKYMNYWYERRPDIMYVNLYGTSEMTGNCLYQVVDGVTERAVVPLNKVFPGYDVFLLDDDDKVVSGPGAVGEICAGGTLIAVGQLGKAMDPEKFVKSPFAGKENDIIYRTGDVVRITSDGAYVFLSRKDFCFKHAGYRIEPGDVEEYFYKLDYISVATILYDPVLQHIVLFWSGDKSHEADIQEYAVNNMPVHMHPGKYVYLDSFPLNNSGKVDKAGLMNWIKKTEGRCDIDFDQI